MSSPQFPKHSSSSSNEPIVTAEKYLKYKKINGHFNAFVPPKIVLICYQQSTLLHFLSHLPNMKQSDSVSDLFFIEGSQVAILGGWGIGAPALAFKMEELIALGVDKFIAVGTAGTLMDSYPIGDFIIASKALAEDGVAHLYLNGKPFAEGSEEMISDWNTFTNKHSLPTFQITGSWSFSAIFRETPSDVMRVKDMGCGVVEMEAATLYAIGEEKGVQTLSLFVVSDSLTQEEWIPHLKEPIVRNNLHKLAKWALEFCKDTEF